MKIAALLVVVLLAACGRSECQKAAAVYCGKIASCGLPVVEGDGSVRVYRFIDEKSADACEGETMKFYDLAEIAESQCEVVKEAMLPMNCPAFFDYIIGSPSPAEESTSR